MPYGFIRNIILLIGLSLCNISAQAATAYANVSARVVALSSFTMTDSIVLSGIRNNNNKENKGLLELSTFDTKNAAKFKVSSSNNQIYDISISSATAFSDGDNLLEINNFKILNNLNNSNFNGEHEIKLGGAVLQDAGNNRSYKGQTTITINYN